MPGRKQYRKMYLLSVVVHTKAVVSGVMNWGQVECIIEAIFTSTENCLQCLLWHLTPQEWLTPAFHPKCHLWGENENARGLGTDQGSG